MLIRVLPRSPGDSSIMFHLSLPSLPASLPNPASWEQQLSTLLADDLQVPGSLYALDKSAMFPALLEEVSFNLPLGIVCCRFIDLSVERWPITRSCMLSIDAVLEHLSKSTQEAPTESAPIREKSSTTSTTKKQAKRLSLPDFQTTFHKITGRHRRQRSLFKSWLSSLVSPRILCLSFSPRHKSANPEPAKRIVSVSPLKSYEHRLMARSTLLDTFRRHVLPELKNRFPPCGYYLWIAQSLLGRASKRLEEIKERIGGDAIQLCPVRLTDSSYTTDEDDPPSPISSTGDSDSTRVDDTSSSETDESSLLPTPSSAKFAGDTLVHVVPVQETDSQHPSSIPDDTSVVSKDIVEYNHYVVMANRLRELLAQVESNDRHAEHERQHRESILELRSRRRAWLNRSLVGGISLERNRMLSQPYEKSPLHHCRYSWEEDSDVDSTDSYPLLMETKLFPVTEEDEDDPSVDGFPGMVHSMFSDRGRPRVGSAFGAHAGVSPVLRPSQADTSFVFDTNPDLPENCSEATPVTDFS